MLTVAVTGNVASGKSLLCEVWAEAGVPLVQADALAREAVKPGTTGLDSVVEAFGSRVLDGEGRLDRGTLRSVVFSDPDARRRLEAILHPIINRLRSDWIRARQEEGSSLAVAEIPLLYEVGLETEFDVVVLVDAPVPERLRRLTEKRGLEKEEARRIMDSQMPVDEKRRKVDYVVENGEGVEDLRIRALALLDLLRARARAAGTERAP